MSPNCESGPPSPKNCREGEVSIVTTNWREGGTALIMNCRGPKTRLRSKHNTKHVAISMSYRHYDIHASPMKHAIAILMTYNHYDIHVRPLINALRKQSIYNPPIMTGLFQNSNACQKRTRVSPMMTGLFLNLKICRTKSRFAFNQR